jgi:hypothetical protein
MISHDVIDNEENERLRGVIKRLVGELGWRLTDDGGGDGRYVYMCAGCGESAPTKASVAHRDDCCVHEAMEAVKATP